MPRSPRRWGSAGVAEAAIARGRPAAADAALIAGRIVDAAWAAVLESGPEALSLDRVAALARASKQTIYARFAGKQGLLAAVLEARTGALLTLFDEAAAGARLEQAIAEVTRRSARSLTAPEAQMLERLVDWLDRADPASAGSTRAAVYRAMEDRLRQRLAQAVAEDQLRIEDIDAAARFWLDGLTGHVRGLPHGGEELDRWAETFARMFLKAVSV
jgi:AcrR family transcriptional regulator